jgi:hypothetical protein
MSSWSGYRIRHCCSKLVASFANALGISATVAEQRGEVCFGVDAPDQALLGEAVGDIKLVVVYMLAVACQPWEYDGDMTEL